MAQGKAGLRVQASPKRQHPGGPFVGQAPFGLVHIAKQQANGQFFPHLAHRHAGARCLKLARQALGGQQAGVPVVGTNAACRARSRQCGGQSGLLQQLQTMLQAAKRGCAGNQNVHGLIY